MKVALMNDRYEDCGSLHADATNGEPAIIEIEGPRGSITLSIHERPNGRHPFLTVWYEGEYAEQIELRRDTE